jgi:hypothetical protein
VMIALLHSTSSSVGYKVCRHVLCLVLNAELRGLNCKEDASFGARLHGIFSCAMSCCRCQVTRLALLL